MNALTEQNKIVDKNSILDEAIYRCIKEMYYHAQPSVDITQVKKDAEKNGVEVNTIDMCYLSKEMYEAIVDKYIDAYHLKNYFQNGLELLLSYFEHPHVLDFSKGYKTHVEIQPLVDIIGKDCLDEVVDYIDKCKNYYNRNMDAESFRFNVMNYSPTSNKQTVIDYWKARGKDIEIKDYSSDEIYELVYYGHIISEDE